MLNLSFNSVSELRSWLKKRRITRAEARKPTASDCKISLTVVMPSPFVVRNTTTELAGD